MTTTWIKDQQGKEYPIKFSQGVFTQLAILEKVPADQIQKFLSSFGSWPIGRIYTFYYLAFKTACRKEKVDFDFSEEEFIDWITDDETVMPQIIEVFKNSTPAADEKKTPAKRGSR